MMINWEKQFMIFDSSSRADCKPSQKTLKNTLEGVHNSGDTWNQELFMLFLHVMLLLHHIVWKQQKILSLVCSDRWAISHRKLNNFMIYPQVGFYQFHLMEFYFSMCLAFHTSLTFDSVPEMYWKMSDKGIGITVLSIMMILYLIKPG